MENNYTNIATGNSGLPMQKIPRIKKTKEWGKACVNYYSNYRYSDGTSLRASRMNKLINYDLYNGKIHKSDVERICDPLGIESRNWDDKFQHYDIISEPLRLLIGDEATRPDNFTAIAEGPSDLSRKSDNLKSAIKNSIVEQIVAEFNGQIGQDHPLLKKFDKYNNYSLPDLIEIKANRLLKRERKRINTKEVFSRGWKDALIAGEEIYWVGILNGEPCLRRVNPVNVSVILDDDTQYIDDAVAVVEERMLTISSILDEYGDKLSDTDLDKLYKYAKGTFGNFNTAGGFEPQFMVTGDSSSIAGITPLPSSNYNSVNNESLRVMRVEWMSFMEVGDLTYTDEMGQPQSEMVDDTFDLKIFKMSYPDAKVEWYWINEPWEGLRAGADIYFGIQPKENQRRRMDNPYYCKLGYTGFIYEATNSKSVSLVDRLKSYQYLYDYVYFRFEKSLARDKGKVFLMDMAQLPESMGVDIEQWLYYLNDMGIALINSFEEGKKGFATGQLSKFNQFQEIDLTMAQSINSFIQILESIKNQVYFVSGVSPQRMSEISNTELVGNVERSIMQSNVITEYLFMAHDEVKRRAYTALLEVCKMTYRKGLVSQYALDDMSIEMLEILPNEFEDSEFSVFITNSNKDNAFKQKLEQLMAEAMKSQLIGISAVANSLIDDSPRDIIRKLELAEQEMAEAKARQQEAEANADNNRLRIEKQMHDENLDLEHRKLELDQYISDTANETKIQVAEINAMRAMEGPVDMDGNGIPDAVEVANLALKERDLSSKLFTEKLKLQHDKEKHKNDMSLKDKELQLKKEIEDKKIKAIKEQNKSQEKIASEANKLKEKELKAKERIEKIKARAAKAKAKSSKK